MTVSSISKYKGILVIVIEAIGWETVAPTKIGNLFIDRLATMSCLLEQYSITSWLVIQGRAINLTQSSISIHD